MNPNFVCGWFVVTIGLLSSTGSLVANPLTDKRLNENSVERFVAVYSHVADLPSKAVEGRLKQFPYKNLSPRVQKELQIALLQRLSNDDPNAALEFSLGREEDESEKFVRIVFDVWVTIDLEEVIDRARDLNWRASHQALDSIVRAYSELPLTELRDIASKMSLDRKLAVELYGTHVNVELIEDPRKSWYEIAELTAEDNSWYENRALFERLATRWFIDDGFAVLDEIRNGSKNGFSWYSVESYSVEAILKSATKSSPQDAFEYVTNLPRREYILEDIVIRRWATADLRSAIDAVAAISSDDMKEDFQRDIAGIWAEMEPRYILQNLDVIPAKARFVAARVGVRTIAKSSLHEAGDFALQIEDSSLRTIAVRWLLPIWSKEEPHSLLDWLLKDSSDTGLIEEIREQLVFNLLDSDPIRAFQLAREHPIADWEPGWDGQIRQSQLMIPSDTSGVGLEAQIFDDISESDLALALELLEDVREGITKRVATLQVGRALRYRGDIQEAIDLAQKLTETERDWYFSLIIFDWIKGDPSGLADEISKFPKEETRSTVAQRLLRWNRRYDQLSEKQIDTLQKHLTEDDRDQLHFPW
ncbi:MAG: hypothetical protein F4X56_05490 [Gammaproteobacteria bacterium]|nr:hypothetical protein [Gammaproteobacteria bacterium]MYC25355.1 hypothetical protein [Gammaproteobacteria bacterium]